MKTSVNLQEEIERLRGELDAAIARESEIAQALPCPFCGGSAGLQEKRGDWGYTSGVVWVQCSACGASCAHLSCKSDDIMPVEKANAIRQWNRRSLGVTSPIDGAQ